MYRFIPISTLLTFPRLRNLSDDKALIMESVRGSEVVKLDEENERLGKMNDLPEEGEGTNDQAERTIYVKGFPKDATLDELLDYFDQFGEVGAVRMRRFNHGKKEEEEEKSSSTNFKGSVLVEFNSKVLNYYLNCKCDYFN